MINVSDLDPAELLAALYNAIDVGGRLGLPSFPRPMSYAEARQVIAEHTRDGVCRIDYLNGRAIKVEFGPQVDERLYDRDNGAGAFQLVVDQIRGKSSIVEHETKWIIFQDGELKPSRDHGEHVLVRPRVYERFDLPTKSQVRRERRRLARQGVHGRRTWRQKTRRVSLSDAEWSLTPIREVRHEEYTAIRIGFGTTVNDWRKPESLWPKLTRRACVYVKSGSQLPDHIRTQVERDLQYDLKSAAVKLYERIKLYR